MNPIYYFHNPAKKPVEEKPLTPEEELKLAAKTVADRLGQRLEVAKIQYNRTDERILTSVWIDNWQVEVFVERKGHKYRGVPTGKLRIVFRDYNNPDVKFPPFSDITDEDLDALVSLIAPLVLERLKSHGAHGAVLEHYRLIALKPQRYRYIVKDSRGVIIDEVTVRARTAPLADALAQKALSLKGICIIGREASVDLKPGRDVFVTTQVVRGLHKRFRFILKDALDAFVADETVCAGDYESAKAVLEESLKPRGIVVRKWGPAEEKRFGQDAVLLTQIARVAFEAVPRPPPRPAPFIRPIKVFKKDLGTYVIRRGGAKLKSKKKKKTRSNPIRLVGAPTYVVRALHAYVTDIFSEVILERSLQKAQMMGGWSLQQTINKKHAKVSAEYEFPTRERATEFAMWLRSTYPMAFVAFEERR